MIQLSANNISVQINQKIICHDLSFDLHAREVIGILGPNGVGKTTLLHALSGLHPIVRGEIRLNKIPLSSHTAKTIAQHLAILFQDFNSLLPQTVWEYCLASRFPHVSYFKKTSIEDENIVREILHKMELDVYLRTVITKLSGGEKRRLAIAAVLSQTPNIYLLDEPTNHLDLRYQTLVLNHFRQLALNESKAVMMTLHDINLAQQYCDRVLLFYPDGETMIGRTDEMLTIENISRLYQCSMKRIISENNSYWMSLV